MLISFLAITGFFSLNAVALDLPSFEVPRPKSIARLETEIEIKKFRVLVFPHFGVYSTPQGREVNAASVRISSSEPCTGYRARLDQNQEWQKEGAEIDRTSNITFTLKKLNLFHHLHAATAIYYSCSAPFTVNRAAPLKSYSYPGDFVVIRKGTQVHVVNIVDPDSYLKGVVPAEVYPTWPMETLKAQAVAARSYAMWTVVNTRKDTEVRNFDMDDTVQYQAYLGNNIRTEPTDRATDETAGLVMKANGEVIKSYFSADSGGYTEDSSSAFGEELSYCKSKAESYDLAASQTQTAWEKSFTFTDLRKKLVASRLLPASVTIRGITIDEKSRNASGRVMKLSILGTNKQTYLVDGAAFRFSTKVRSTLFYVVVSGSSVNVVGKGYGHGVGMAQVGASEYARQLNWTYDQILKFYYDGVEITTQ